MGAYDEEIRIYEDVVNGKLSKFPARFFYDRNVTKKIIRYVVGKEYGEITEKIVKELDSSFFIKRRLKSALAFNSPFPILIAETFEEFHIEPFELRRVPNTYWQKKENRIYYLNWLFKKFDINLDDKNSIRQITAEVLIANYGSRAYKSAGGVFELLNEVLQDRYKVWEIMDVPFWNEDLSKEAIVWLIEKKLGYSKGEVENWNVKDISKMCTKRDIESNNLEGLWKNRFGHNVIKMVTSVY